MRVCEYSWARLLKQTEQFKLTSELPVSTNSKSLLKKNSLIKLSRNFFVQNTVRDIKAP